LNKLTCGTPAAGDRFALTALWVRGGETWYLVTYFWYGEGADFIVILSVQEVPEPDLAGCDRLI